MKIYHTETQEDYDDLMIKLENEGYKWRSMSLPTDYLPTTKPPCFIFVREHPRNEISIGYREDIKKGFPDELIIKHKAKGVEQMEKVVVPQCVADWFKAREDVSLRILLNKLARCDDEQVANWVDYVHFLNAQDILAKMHLFGYEVEEEKKYYWRKKKEHMFDFEEQEYSYLNIDKAHRRPVAQFFGNNFNNEFFQTLLTETEVKQLVSEKDFNKLERVEIDDV